MLTETQVNYLATPYLPILSLGEGLLITLPPEQILARFKTPSGGWNQENISQVADPDQLQPQKKGREVEIVTADAGARLLLGAAFLTCPGVGVAQRTDVLELMVQILAARLGLPPKDWLADGVVAKVAPHAAAYLDSLLGVLAAATETHDDELLSPAVQAAKAVRSWFT